MNQTSLARERNRAIAHLIWLAIFIALGFILWAYGLFGYGWLGFSKHTAVIITGIGSVPAIVAVVMSKWAVEAYLDTRENDDDPPPRDTPDASDMLTFDAEHSPPATRIENNTTATQIQRGRYPFTQTQWGSLYKSLKANRWNWNRATLIRAKIFNADNTPGISLTAEGHYNGVCNDFERVGIIAGRRGHWRVSERGMWILSQSAGLKVIT